MAFLSKRRLERRDADPDFPGPVRWVRHESARPQASLCGVSDTVYPERHTVESFTRYRPIPVSGFDQPSLLFTWDDSI